MVYVHADHKALLLPDGRGKVFARQGGTGWQRRPEPQPGQNFLGSPGFGDFHQQIQITHRTQARVRVNQMCQGRAFQNQNPDASSSIRGQDLCQHLSPHPIGVLVTQVEPLQPLFDVWRQLYISGFKMNVEQRPQTMLLGFDNEPLPIFNTTCSFG